ncbi:ACP phosphodiesterase [Neptunicella marina]|uniref:DUF479 domain-containing protein n=1 Tax=Neptunicella marina TaxID=2125989 RepID=A0A8J6IVW2_9ALTE|nr:ACP phosphodiesterase [Neptunicella marina]MBC3766526.1 DUF479 domain-containing protein [Neptunicella marina]
MNYLAHLFLAQPTSDSHFGNLLGDFSRGIDVSKYSDSVVAGLQNHRLVDKFTDNHKDIRLAKQLFSPEYRRVAGIALDILFDHFLIKHWSEYAQVSCDSYCQQAYTLLAVELNKMPARMQRVVTSMVEHQWLQSYQQINGVTYALQRTLSRIRFEHDFVGIVDEIEPNYVELEEVFLNFFPALMQHVQQRAIEHVDKTGI